MGEQVQSKQEILEFLAGVKEVALFAKAIAKDGKVDLSDLGHLMGLIQKQAVLVAAFEGLGNIDLKSMSLDDALEVVTALIVGAKEVKAA